MKRIEKKNEIPSHDAYFTLCEQMHMKYPRRLPTADLVAVPLKFIETVLDYGSIINLLLA